MYYSSSEVCSTPENPLYIRCNYSLPLSKYGLSGSALRPSDKLMTYSLPRDAILKYRTKYGVVLRPKDIILQVESFFFQINVFHETCYRQFALRSRSSCDLLILFLELFSRALHIEQLQEQDMIGITAGSSCRDIAILLL